VGLLAVPGTAAGSQQTLLERHEIFKFARHAFVPVSTPF
jgi:hypothetical protein